MKIREHGQYIIREDGLPAEFIRALRKGDSLMLLDELGGETAYAGVVDWPFEAEGGEIFVDETDAKQDAAVTLATMLAAQLPDEKAFEVPALYPAWESLLAGGKQVGMGQRCRYAGTLRKCLQTHTPQPAWNPDEAPALWAEVPDPAEIWPLIPNPIRATNPFMQGQKGRTEDGRRFISKINNNTWQPDEYPDGWEEQT